MRRPGPLVALVVMLTSVVALAGSVGPVGATHKPFGELLPDLETLEPTDIVVGTASGRRALRFANTVGNHHTGVLELVPTSGGDCNNDGNADNDRLAYQRIYRDANGNGTFDRDVDPESRTVQVGCMQYHPTHNHWHFDGFAVYKLFRLKADGTRGSLVGTSKKTSFCIADYGGRLWPELPGSPAERGYETCDRTSVQGLSIGWSDTYQNFLDGQHVFLPADTSLARYCLVSKADPDNRLLESDNLDNGESIRVTVSGSSVKAKVGSSC